MKCLIEREGVIRLQRLWVILEWIQNVELARCMKVPGYQDDE